MGDLTHHFSAPSHPVIQRVIVRCVHAHLGSQQQEQHFFFTHSTLSHSSPLPRLLRVSRSSSRFFIPIPPRTRDLLLMPHTLFSFFTMFFRVQVETSLHLSVMLCGMQVRPSKRAFKRNFTNRTAEEHRSSKEEYTNPERTARNMSERVSFTRMRFGASFGRFISFSFSSVSLPYRLYSYEHVEIQDDQIAVVVLC
ncbi:hypothetical protein DIPPA_70059 [Diplonema papillatum]|nr:hypothetical protein DIPPA_70059 [Diplonema papillatum]